MKNLTWQNPEQLLVAQELINKVKSKCCGIKVKDFVKQGNEVIVMTDSGRKIILSAWQNRKKEQITHPYLNEKVNIGLLPYVQAMLLARFIRKDIDDYPVFLIK